VFFSLCPLCLCGSLSSEPQRRTTPLPLEQALAGFRVDPGLRVELVAAEPEIESPVAMAFDEDGRLWVVEMLDYPNGPAKGQPPEGRIKVLEDRDGDGRFETARVFADKLLFANGVMPWKGGVIVTAAPHILELHDTDGDGKADERKILYEGFTTANVQLRVSHPILGPDNFVYVANGLRGGQIRAGDSKGSPPISINGMDFRFDLITGKHEAISGMGQYGNTFDDWGNRFVCDNNHHLRHVVVENAYLGRNPFLAKTTVLADISELPADVPGAGVKVFPISRNWTTSNLHAGHFTAACGVFIYRGTLLPEPYRGAAFTCEPTGNLVHAEKLQPVGSTFRSRPLRDGVEFLATTDEWFRPVFLTSGPDGALYVVDMSRAVIEHPEWMPPELKNRPDLNDGKHTGRIWRIVPDRLPAKRSGTRPNLSRATTAELVKHLDNADAWWCTTAQRLILQRDDPAAEPLLRELLKHSAHLTARIHAAWLLQHADRLHETDIVTLLDDKSPRVREQAVVLAEPRLPASGKIQSRLLELARDPDERLRDQVALSLGAWNDDRVVEPLAGIARSRASDQWTRAAVASAVPTRAGKLLARLLDGPQDATGGLPLMMIDLASIVGARQDPAEVTACLTALQTASARPGRPDPLRLLAAIADGMARRGKSLNDFVAKLRDAQRDLRDWIDLMFRAAAAIVSDSRASSKARLSAIQVLASGSWETAGPVLSAVLDDDAEQDLRLAAVRSLAAHSAAEAAPVLLKPWRRYTPVLRREVAEVLARQPDRALLLIAAVEAGEVKPADLDPTVMRRLTSHAKSEIRDRAKKALEASLPADRKEVLEKYQAALKTESDARRGREVFTKNCATCHAVAGVGVNVGADISDTRGKTPGQLLNDILNPNAAVDGNFIEYLVTLKNGKQISGVIAGETAAGLTLKRAQNQTDTVLRSEIEEVQSTGRSLMPEGLEKQITIAEMADLIAFLKNWRYLDGAVPLGK
jgi:putative membrane-bound dehydrogenase-like protein